jgi:hypothetical protein
MIEVESILNPAIFKSPTSGKTYVVAGDQPWIEVPEGTTLNDVRWERPPQPQKDPVDAQEQIFEVEGSKGNKYTVKCGANNSWSCECVGYGYRQRCKHIARAKERIS